MNEKPVVRHCPVCGTAMVAESHQPNSADRLRLTCFNCGTVVVVSHPRDEGPKEESLLAS